MYIMEAYMKVSKWGNSLAVRLPAEVVEALSIKEGDEVMLKAVDRRDFDISQRPTRQDVILELRKYRGTIPADFKFDREEANAR